MKNFFNTPSPTFDAEAINATIQQALNSAGLDTKTGPMLEVTETIRRALGTKHSVDVTPNKEASTFIDVSSRFVSADEAPQAAQTDDAVNHRTLPVAGSFETHHFSNAAGSRAYKVYVPSNPATAPRPMVVMLHGCTQCASDFAAGTQMNRLADEHGFLVVYPEQGTQDNASKCWNWFKPQDQLRGAGEPSLIAGMVREAALRHEADPRRIFVAGLSAGAAMAVVLGETYPELFAGVGAHSGLPYGSAHDIPSAMAAMKGGRSGLTELKKSLKSAAAPRKKAKQAVPVIVFHGDRDHTVQLTNGTDIAQQAQDAHAAQPDTASLRVSSHTGAATGGRRFSRSVHTDADGQVWIENWVLHGAGHAWSGGHASGTFTDNHGPDASAEMVRFFMTQPRAGTA